MEKIISIIIVAMFALGGLGVVAVAHDGSTDHTAIPASITHSISFSAPTITENNGYLTVNIRGATTTLSEPNDPELPAYVKTYEIPFGSQDITVTCTPTDIQTMTVKEKIMPARIAPLSEMNEKQIVQPDQSVYGSSALYPSDWYTSELGAGRNTDDKEVTFVKVVCYPARYAPADNQLDYTSGFDITITYEPPTHPTVVAATTDMVIIAPKLFKSALQPLIDFKNSMGLNTTFKSIEDIFKEYQGADPPEQVKMYIKDAYDTSGITYVLIVGGLKNHIYAKDKEDRSYGSKAWYVPVRYVNIPQGDDEGCLCDLYYGCLYNGTGAFDSWDSNGDGIYAAWNASTGIPNDIFDMNPEVYVGRLPVSNLIELKLVVNKILAYESTGPADKSWYTTMIAVGGKTFENYSGQPDGEYLGDLALSNMSSIITNPVRVYSTNRLSGGLVPIPTDIIKAVSGGAGFIDFEGHGNPVVWDTIWDNGTYPEDWCGGVNLLNFLRFRNGDKLPVVVVGGCHNGLYNITMLPSKKDKAGIQYFTYGMATPVCFSWFFVLKSHGGAIASTGDTGYGMGNEGDPVSLSAELETNFFYEIGVNGSTHLGQAHGQAIHKFIADEPIGDVEAFCITDWALFGDPSLLFGGYSS